jgi:hypothetical protein
MVLVLCGAMFVAANAGAAPAHVHGIARLDIAIDGEALQLSLESPLANLVGFEHAPSNAQETQAVSAMVLRFSRPEELFAPSPAARCSVKSIQLSSPVIDAKLLAVPGVPAPPPAAAGAPHDEDGHAELEVQIAFRCERPGELKRLEARIFSAFPAMLQLDVQVVTPSRQSAAKLTAKSNAIAF